MNKLKSFLLIAISIINFLFISYLALALVLKITRDTETWWILLSPAIGIFWVWLWFKFKYKQDVAWSNAGINIIILASIYYCVSSYKPVVMYLLDHNVVYKEILSDSIKNDTDVLLKYANNGEYYWAMNISGDRVRDSEIFMKTLVSHDGRFLKYASNRLQDSEDIVKVAISSQGYAVEYASDRLKNDSNIIAEAIAKGGFRVILFSGEKIRNNPEMVDNFITTYLEEKDIHGSEVISLCETIEELKYTGKKYNELNDNCKSLLLLKLFEEMKELQKEHQEESKKYIEKLKNIKCYPKYMKVGSIKMLVGSECY